MQIDLAAWADSLRSDVDTNLGASIVVEVLDSYLREETRRRLSNPVQIVDLSRLKVAVRLGSELLDHVLDTQFERMSGWRFLQKPTNDVQVFYTALYSVLQDIGFFIATIEHGMPKLKQQFEEERAAFQRSYEDDAGAERLQKIAGELLPQRYASS